VLVQCRALEELPWKDLGPFSDIDLIVCRPIQAELDKHKNQGRDRLAKRARVASALIKKVITSGEDAGIIRPAKPCVRLFVQLHHRPSSDLASTLDYGERDDLLVGIVAEYRRLHPEADARILTHDGGPMAAAKMVTVPFLAVPDNWLLSPEPTSQEKRLDSLERKVEELQSREPQFQIVCQTEAGSSVEQIDDVVTKYLPLTGAEIHDLLGRIRSELPKSTVSKEPNSSAEMTSRLMGGHFVPPSNESIAAYETQYSEWFKECEDRLKRWHKIGAPGIRGPRFRFAATNAGTRPATNALISIRAQGNFRIVVPPLRPRRRDKEEANEGKLPLPPEAPKGRIVHYGDRFSAELLSRATDGFTPYLGASSALAEFARMSPFLDRASLTTNERRDPNAFYWKPHRPEGEVDEVVLECEQWRHGQEPELFTGGLRIVKGDQEGRGALVCTIHAANLSAPATITTPVRLRVEHQSVRPMASAAIDDLIKQLSKRR
jgi:hypothetical protein